MTTEKPGWLLMPEIPTDDMLDRVVAGVSDEWRSYRRERARQIYRDFVRAVRVLNSQEADDAQPKT